MSNDWFFEKFSLIADAPGAVERMRGLVLDWALSGKFSQKSEVPFKYVRLDSVADIRMGNSPPGHSYNETGQGVPLINGPVEFSSGPLGLTVRTKFTTSPTKLCKRGDLLICVRGSTTGRTNIAAFDACIGRGVAAITAHDNQIYINLFVWSQRAKIFALGTGSTFPSISHDDLASLELTLPPLAEQKRIAAKVEELMGICDALESQQQERESRKSVLVRASLSRFAESPTPENLGYLFHKSYDIPPSELRKSILTLAVQGKLVPQDPNDEPAEKILARIDSTPKRAMRTKEGAKEVDESTESEVLFDLPPGWQWVPFRRLPLQASVGIDRGRSTQGSEKAFGYFKMNNIRNSGGVDLSDLTRIDAKPSEVEAFSLANGDFLFNTRNSRELVGKTCVFRSFSDDPILYNNNILRVRFIEGFSPEFLDYWFRSPQGRAELEKLKSNTTNVCAIYQGKLSCFPCVIPPLAEQHRIVAKVDQLMALVDELERQQETSRENASKLLDAIVQEMTNGGRGIAATLES